MNICVALPLLSLLFIFLIFYNQERLKNSDSPIRLSFLSAAIVFGVLSIGVAEVLSIFKLFTFGWLLGTWLFVLAVLGIIYKRYPKENVKVFRFSGRIPPFPVFLLSCVVFIILVVGLIAFIAPPNTCDSMTYHMGRVAHWAQNGSIGLYPTHITRQLIYPPCAEIIITHFQILSGGDRFANFIQWFSMIGCIIGVSLVAKLLGADLRGQIIASVVCATIPMGILQGSSTQNDYVAAFWLVCLVSYIILAVQRGIKPLILFNIGSSLGLLFLTKGTAFVYALPLLVWFMFAQIKRHGIKAWKGLVFAACIALIINTGYYTRNLTLGRSYFDSGLRSVFNEKIGIDVLASNMLRDVSLNFGTPYKRINSRIEKSIEQMHKFLNIDINDSRTTFPYYGVPKFSVPQLVMHEDDAGNPTHLVLIVLSSIVFLLSRKFKYRRDLLRYFVILITIFLMLCLFIKWQRWLSRFYLPLFVLWSPFIAIILSGIKIRKVVNLVLVVLVLTAVPYLFYNRTRAILGERSIFTKSRAELYFMNRPDLYVPYLALSDFLKSQACRDIGIILGGDDFEYPLWALLQENKSGHFIIKHVYIRNGLHNKQYVLKDSDNSSPCAIVYLGLGEYSKKVLGLVAGDSRYQKIWSQHSISVYAFR